MKTFIVFWLFFLLSLTPLATLYSQSGRNRTVPPVAEKSAKPPAEREVEAGSSTEASDGISQSRLGEEGETVEDDIIRVDTSLVMVPVSVMDRGGKYVPTLRRQDFRIFEDGVEQKIAYFGTVDQPFTVVLLIDTSGSTRFRLEDIQNSAINFVSKLKPEDSVMIVAFDDGIDVMTKATTDRNAITRAIRRTRAGGGTRLYDAVDATLKQHLKTITGRKAVVLFTDGVDTTSRRSSYDRTVRDAEESDATFYSVGYDTEGSVMMGQGVPWPGSRGGIIFGIPFPRPGGGGGVPGTNPGDYRRAREYLQTLSDRTGGRYYSADSMVGISQAFTWIAEELGRQYSLGYYPKTIGQAGQRRQIKVRVNQPDVVVKARDSYIHTQKTSSNNPKVGADDKADKQPYVSQLKER